MILKDKLYEIRDRKVNENEAIYTVAMLSDSVIYKAHFPNEPMTPGVCLVQMVKELLELSLDKRFELVDAKNVKFLNILIPTSRTADFHIKWEQNPESDQLHVNAVISDSERVYSKMSLFFRLKTLENASETLNYCVIIPVYNNEKTVADVVGNVLRYAEHVIVVNDGSTDNTRQNLQPFADSIELVEYPDNRGKGYALQQGFSRARALGFEHAVTMDADGQHLASDIPVLMQAVKENPEALIVGARSFKQENMPTQNVKANRFSNFWFTVQTFCKLPDTQTGFRVYPLHKMGDMQIHWYRYEAELDMLVRCAWRNIPLVSVPVQVYYPPKEERVSHFRPGRDFLRISLLNTALCLAAIVYGWPRILFHKLFVR